MDVGKVSINSIPLTEFVALLKKAQIAVDGGDVQTALSINERIQTVGYSLVVRNGEVLLSNNTQKQAAED